jgi:hypothetical protein
MSIIIKLNEFIKAVNNKQLPRNISSSQLHRDVKIAYKKKELTLSEFLKEYKDEAFINNLYEITYICFQVDYKKLFDKIINNNLPDDFIITNLEETQILYNNEYMSFNDFILEYANLPNIKLLVLLKKLIKMEYSVYDITFSEELILKKINELDFPGKLIRDRYIKLKKFKTFDKFIASIDKKKLIVLGYFKVNINLNELIDILLLYYNNHICINNINKLKIVYENKRISINDFINLYQIERNYSNKISISELYRYLLKAGCKFTKDNFINLIKKSENYELVDFYYNDCNFKDNKLLLDCIINYEDFSMFGQLLKISKASNYSNIDRLCFHNYKHKYGRLICYERLIENGYIFKNNFILYLIINDINNITDKDDYKISNTIKTILNSDQIKSNNNINVTKDDIIKASKYYLPIDGDKITIININFNFS